MNEQQQAMTKQITKLINALHFSQEQRTSSLATTSISSENNNRVRKHVSNFETYDDIKRSLYSMFQINLQVNLLIDADLFCNENESVMYCFERLKYKASERIHS